MKKIVFYGHGSSCNHGVEAIMRSTINILKKNEISVYTCVISNDVNGDKKWNLDNCVDEILSAPKASFVARVFHKIFSILHIKESFINNSIAKRTVKLMKDVDLAVSVGGDNFCYSKEYNKLFFKINSLLKKRNVKTVFWGCSIEEEFIDKAMLNDLRKYDLITVRESLTLQNLKKYGIWENVKYFPDPAFQLNMITPEIKLKKNTIGLNISPLILDYNKEGSIVLDNYSNLIEYILSNTKYNIALIPHVNINGNSDLTTIKVLMDKFNDDRITAIDEMGCQEIKGIIAQCKLFIGARTHSTIAAYSNCIPTLVVGYSVKAKGIAKDLFGDYKKLVLPVQSLKNSNSLVNSFKYLDENQKEIKERLVSVMDEYKLNSLAAGMEIKKFICDTSEKGVIEKKLCTGCSACKQICPKDAISFVPDENGFLYPKIDTEKCIQCGLCKNVCPILNKEEKEFDNLFYMAWNKDNTDRINGSSGGVFASIAKYVYKNEGIVYGAAFDKNFKLHHVRTENVEELPPLLGSKYLQSDVGDIFKDVKKDLQDDKLVLFVGTPCQVYGLKLFLKKEYKNLILCDFVCHGVPSQKIFDKYIENTKDLESFSFRDKTHGWITFSIRKKFNNGKIDICKFPEDMYMKGFLNNLYLRESCYNCKFTNLNRHSDITLGDFWGIEKYYPDIDYQNGVSLVIINSTIGEEVFNEIKKELKTRKVDKNIAIENNACLEKPVRYNNNRNKFLETLDQKSFQKNVKDNLPKESLISKVKKVIKKLIRRNHG